VAGGERRQWKSVAGCLPWQGRNREDEGDEAQAVVRAWEGE